MEVSSANRKLSELPTAGQSAQLALNRDYAQNPLLGLAGVKECKRLWLLKTLFHEIRKNKIASGSPTIDFLGSPRHFLSP
jgi:hypothetical protein